MLSATVISNKLTASLDGTQLISIPNLSAATTTAAKDSDNPPSSPAMPTAGQYGLRAWGAALATVQQATVTPLL